VVADCVRSIREAIDLPVTVKSRIGVDDHEDYEFLRRFVETVADAGCGVFIVHARKAVLEGLSPKQNRLVPPLQYEFVHRLKTDFPDLTVVLNGGIRSIDTAREQLALLDGVMIGREAYHNPWFLAEAEAELLAGRPPPSRLAVIDAMIPYIEAGLADGARLHAMTRHMLGLFAGQPGARAWRRALSERATAVGAGVEVVEGALEAAGISR
jgi:tRNA-dihydrouridine synthase A